MDGARGEPRVNPKFLDQQCEYALESERKLCDNKLDSSTRSLEENLDAASAKAEDELRDTVGGEG